MANDFLEKTLEEIVFENRELIHERGLPKFYKNTKRQYLLPSGKKIDILSWEIDDQENSFYGRVIELKREEVTERSVIQALEYYDEIWCIVKNNFKNIFMDVIVVGTTHNREASTINHFTNDLSIYTYKYQFDGLFFKKYPINREYARSLEMYPDDKEIAALNFLKNP